MQRLRGKRNLKCWRKLQRAKVMGKRATKMWRGRKRPDGINFCRSMIGFDLHPESSGLK